MIFFSNNYKLLIFLEMKKIIFFLLLLLTAANLIAQSVSYTYDNAGNRIARVILMSKSPAAPVEAITALPINFL